MRTILPLLALAAIAGALAAALIVVALAAQPEPVEILLIVDGVAIGTVEPGSFTYDLGASVIDVRTNEIVYGCQQGRVFRDRFE